MAEHLNGLLKSVAEREQTVTTVRKLNETLMTNDLLLMESNQTVCIKFEYSICVRLSLFKREIVRNEIDDSNARDTPAKKTSY